MWVWFVGVAMGVTYVLEASLKKLAPMCVTPVRVSRSLAYNVLDHKHRASLPSSVT